MQSAANDSATATNIKEKRLSFIKSTSCCWRFGIWAVPKRLGIPSPAVQLQPFVLREFYYYILHISIETCRIDAFQEHAGACPVNAKAQGWYMSQQTQKQKQEQLSTVTKSNKGKIRWHKAGSRKLSVRNTSSRTWVTVRMIERVQERAWTQLLDGAG